MRLNSDALYLSLMARAFDKEIVPELHSAGTKAVADVMRLSLAELLRRRRHTPAILERTNRAARTLVAEGLSLAERHRIDEPRGDDAGGTAVAPFEALAAESEHLTTRLARLGRHLATAGGDTRADDEVKRFLRRAAEWEYALHADLVQSSPSASEPMPADPLPRQALESFLRASLGDGVSVRALARAEGGYGKQTYFATIDEAGGRERQLVVRKADPVMSVRFGAFIVEREFHLLSAVAAAGFPAPRPLCLGSGVDGIEGDFFVMERLAGHPPGSLLGGAQRLPERYVLDLAELLARLHGMALERFAGYIDRYEPPSLRSETIGQCYRRSIAEWRRHVMEVTQVDSPVMEYLFAWLDDNVPNDAGRPVLVHGDFNIHNVLADDQGRVGGVLDWECAMFGAPEQDLAYLKPHISSHIAWDQFVSHYRQSGGRPPDEDSLAFYQAFSAMRVMNGLQWFTKKLQNGESREFRLCMAELGFAPQFMGFALEHGRAPG